MNSPTIAFERKPLTIPLDKIYPIRPLKNVDKRRPRYNKIRASIQKLGVVEPLMVYPKGSGGFYLIMDGHHRYYAMKELGVKTAKCLIATENESYTYNARVNRLNPMQEYRMIAQAVKNGLSLKQISEVLCIGVKKLEARLNMMSGIDGRAVELLKASSITPHALQIFRRVKPERQIEMAELMVSVSDYTRPYAEALLAGTPRHLLVHPDKNKGNLSLEQMMKLEQEMGALEREFKQVQANFADNMLTLTVAVGYLRKILNNARVVRHLSLNYAEIHAQLDFIARPGSV
jgi:hypothetical protein